MSHPLWPRYFKPTDFSSRIDRTITPLPHSRLAPAALAETRLAVASDVDGSFPVAAQQRTLGPGLLGSYSCRKPDGGLWQELNPGRPDIPITDVIPEHDELAMASHGQGFWALDNITALGQPELGTTDRDLVLFDPAVACRSANGEERDRWAGPALPMATGLNRVRWDLRTDPAATFPGMVLWGVRTMSPAVPPGTYAVRLTVGERVETTEVEVRPTRGSRT